MGRKATRWANLPKGMRARPRGKLIHYYLDTGAKPRKEIPLGSDYVLAVKKWAELSMTKTPAADSTTWLYVAGCYQIDIIPTKGFRTRRDNERELIALRKFFGTPPAPLEEIEPVHIRQFLDWRMAEAKAAEEAKNLARRKAGKPFKPVAANRGHVVANREAALFSHIWNYAREQGFTAKPNPCSGVRRFKELGRDVAPDAELLAKVLAVADQPLQFALRLADLVGQRPADVHRISEADCRDGYVHVRQGKTKARLRIALEGALAALIEEILEFKKGKTVHSLALLVDETGKALGIHAIRSRFDKARAAAGVSKDDFQFRDLRAKAATEIDEASGVKAAQALLGHTTEAMTVKYIRRKAGRKVSSSR